MLRRGRRDRLWAVRHVDIDLERGESIGIIGRNGSGKSTTLSMLAGVTAPTEGVVEVNGRIAPLLRLGVGFDQELTGRENVYMNGMILGMTEKEIDRRFDDVVAFAELEQFIDTPVKFYSSGMLVRLGFSSAVSADPDLLIVDEVLAVGDISFQMRSFDRMLEMRENGATLVVVSHSMHAIRRLAETTIVLHDGDVHFRGPTGDAISMYHDLQRDSMASAAQLTGEETESVHVLSFEMLDTDGNPTANVSYGESATFLMKVRFDDPVEHAVFGIAITTESQQLVYAENSAEHGLMTIDGGQERTFRIAVKMSLVSGSYSAIGGVTWGSVVKSRVNALPKIFYVSGRRLVRGVADLDATFEIADAAPTRDGRSEVLPHDDQ